MCRGNRGRSVIVLMILESFTKPLAGARREVESRGVPAEENTLT